MPANVHCFRCYGVNGRASGVCEHCGGEIAPPPEISYNERLAWTLRHPDPDRAVMAARLLGERGAKSAIESLTSVVRDPPDPYVAAEALQSLVRIEGVERLRPLLEEGANADSFMVADAARAALSGEPRPDGRGRN